MKMKVALANNGKKNINAKKSILIVPIPLERPEKKSLSKRITLCLNYVVIWQNI